MERTDAEFCAQQLRRLDHDRYLTTLFAPGGARERLIALYAFNTEVARVGETVSEPLIGQMWAALVEGRFAAGDLDDADIARVSFFTVPGVLATVFICRVELVQGTHPEDSAQTVLKELPWAGGDAIYVESSFRG